MDCLVKIAKKYRIKINEIQSKSVIKMVSKAFYKSSDRYFDNLKFYSAENGTKILFLLPIIRLIWI